jgi:hypothetical protein
MSFTQQQLYEAYEQMHKEREAESAIAWEDARELEKLAELRTIPQVERGWPCSAWGPYKQTFYFEVLIDSYGSTGSNWFEAQQKEADVNLDKNEAEEAENVRIAQSEVGPNECLARHNWKSWQREMFDRSKSMWFYWTSSKGIDYRVLTKQVDSIW